MAKRRRSRPGRKGRKRPKAGKSPRRRKDSGLHAAIFWAFLLSGFAGLMHQVVWAKLLVQLIGTTAHAQAAVLAVFG